MFKQAILISCLLASGCTTLKDFQAMSPDQRADFVCSQENSVKRLAANINDYHQRLDDVEDALERGYRVHVACHDEWIPACDIHGHDDHEDHNDRHNEKDHDRKSHHDQKKHSKSHYHQVCIETPVAIDWQFETLKKEQYRDALSAAQDDHHQAFSECSERVMPMSAGEAFSYYDR